MNENQSESPETPRQEQQQPPAPLPELGPAFRKAKLVEGRPTKLTDEVQELIVQLIRAGNYIETAVAIAGVHKKTFYEWMKIGAREGEGPYWHFRNAVIKAVGESEALDVARIRMAAEQGDWRAAAWRLERRHMNRWGQRASIKQESTVNMNAQVTVEEHRALFLTLGEILSPYPELKKQVGDLLERSLTPAESTNGHVERIANQSGS